MFLRELLNETLTRTGHGSTAVIGWGRGMGHKGHMYLANAVIHKAKEVHGDPYFVVSRTVGKDDPINPEEKMAIYKKVFPDSSHIFQTATDEMPDLTRVLSNLNQQGYTNAIVVVGADQVKALAYVKNYNNTPDKTGKVHYKFDNLEVISRQETAAPDAQEEGPRATPMRQVLLDPSKSEEEKFAVWRDAMNPEIDDAQVMDLMRKAEQRMKAMPSKKVKEGVFMQKMKNNFGMDQSAYDTKNPGTSPDYVDSNITVQLLKNIDRHGGYPIQFKDGTELHVSSSLSQKILFKIQDLLPKERHAIINHIIQSSDNFKSFAQGLSESMMPKKNFAGSDKHKLGPAAHLTGKMKRPARPGDLVGGAMEESGDTVSPIGSKKGTGPALSGYDMDAMRQATGTMEEDGILDEIAAFHGSFRPRIGKFKFFSHFGSEQAAKERLDYLTAEDPRFKGITTGYLYKLDLGINNPATVRDYPSLQDPSTGNMIKIASWANDLKNDPRVKSYQYQKNERPLAWFANNAKSGYWREWMRPEAFIGEFINLLEKMGIDGFVYKNAVEHKGELSYISFRPENVKIVGRAKPVPLTPPEGVERKEKFTKPGLPFPTKKPKPGEQIFYMMVRGEVFYELSAKDLNGVKAEIRDMRSWGLDIPQGYKIIPAPIDPNPAPAAAPVKKKVKEGLPNANPEDNLQASQIKDMLNKGMAKLNPREQFVVYNIAIKGQSYAKTGLAMGRSGSRVEQIFHKAISKLRYDKFKNQVRPTELMKNVDKTDLGVLESKKNKPG